MARFQNDNVGRTKALEMRRYRSKAPFELSSYVESTKIKMKEPIPNDTPDNRMWC